ncbi:unnamed protein product [Closterium sp. NIES-65]|nr:unnamed protein product [Closterium sp. NIES-65]
MFQLSLLFARLHPLSTHLPAPLHFLPISSRPPLLSTYVTSAPLFSSPVHPSSPSLSPLVLFPHFISIPHPIMSSRTYPSLYNPSSPPLPTRLTAPPSPPLPPSSFPSPPFPNLPLLSLTLSCSPVISLPIQKSLDFPPPFIASIFPPPPLTIVHTQAPAALPVISSPLHSSFSHPSSPSLIAFPQPPSSTFARVHPTLPTLAQRANRIAALKHSLLHTMAQLKSHSPSPNPCPRSVPILPMLRLVPSSQLAQRANRIASLKHSLLHTMAQLKSHSPSPRPAFSLPSLHFPSPSQQPSTRLSPSPWLSPSARPLVSTCTLRLPSIPPCFPHVPPLVPSLGEPSTRWCFPFIRWAHSAVFVYSYTIPT